MSSIYNLEPQPTASIVISTTQGDLSVELFAKQTPITSRNFLQLCLDGYYDNTIFHRLVPGFILQGGDPTGTGNGGESIYDGGAYSGDLEAWPMDQRRGDNAGPNGVNFRDEFHSRLKFNRRGLLGMANDGRKDSNGSQFFFTLDKAEELNNKNTMFGRIAGDTIYNLARIGEAELLEGTDRPQYPVKITGIEILVNPFDDMKKRERVARQSDKSTAATTQVKKKKPKAGKKLLSFGDDEGEEADVPVIKKAKFDTRIVMDVDEEDEPKISSKATKSKSTTDREHIAPKKSLPVRDSQTSEQKPKAVPPPATKERVELSETRDISPEPAAAPTKTKSALEQANEEIAALKASMKRTIHSEPVKEEPKSAIERMIPETSTRGRKRRRAGDNPVAGGDLALFAAFKSKLSQAPAEKAQPSVSVPEEGEEETAGGQDEEAELCDLHFIANCQSCKAWDKADAEQEESDDEGWMAHALSFTADKLGKDLSYRKKAEEELVVIDPREKARTLKEEKRAHREAQTGNSGREWDQARNAKLARQSALAGRGAR